MSFSFPGGRRIQLLDGRLEEQDAEAVVSSDGSHLEMGGGVSRALLRAAGAQLAEQARQFVPVRAGRVVVTPGGKLRARFVFQGVTIGWGVGPKGTPLLPSRDLISEIMAGCFYHADTLNVRRIAFPLLGTGAGGLPREMCLDTMLQYLTRTFVYELTTVQEARIVLFPPRKRPAPQRS